MKAFYRGLARRREALVQRSATQRLQVEVCVADLRNSVTTPMLVGVGAAATLLSSSPRLRAWVVRAWAAYSLIQRLIGR